ncbi:MAG: exodeoxyribonuclease V subunit gamma [Lysobacterales bacterium]
MFHLFYGNDLRSLARQLGERIGASTGNPLTPEVVLIPQIGMRRWLEIELAEQRGIVANVEFRLPGEFVWQVLRANAPGLPQQSTFDREILRWRLMPLLAELAAEPVGAPIAHYLRGDAQALKRLQLAREFAAALERYQAYRRDLLDQWERGAERKEWQAEAWRRLVRASAEPHRARLIGDFLARHATASPAAPHGVPQRLSLFGCLNISPDLLRVFGAIAQYSEVDFHLPSPCGEYWGDLRSVRERLRAGASPLESAEQPLLASWGRVGREFFDQMFSYEEVQPASEQAILREPARATLLGRIQADILRLRTPARDERATAIDADDVSLRVHVCHSPLREVQVLHDHLLDLFERDATLKPRDIAVMTPDVARYSAAIDAVFGALPAGDARRIQYTIADRRAQDEHPVVDVFLSLLGLPASRWSVSELLDLLAVPTVSRRFGLDAGALDDLAHWLAVAGVRWGLDASTRMAFGAGDYRAFSWAEGIERLLVGYASGDDQAVGGIAPVPVIEGHAAAVLGHALVVLRELERLSLAQRVPRSGSEWQILYQRTLDLLLLPDANDRDERRALGALRDALAALAEGTRAGGCNEALDWQTVRAFLAERLADADSAQRFLNGGVSFCGMLPLRAIPFRVIAVLGADDESFPRREPANGISRLEPSLQHARKLGDRAVRDDDRYLFLQLLTSADDVLHLSYTGRDPRSGEAREPSALVAELLEVVTRDYFADANAARRSLLIEHPLQPFARAAFDGSRAGVFTYRQEWCVAAAAGRGGLARPFASRPLPSAGADAPHRLSLDRLVDFWRNPARAFLRDRLHLNLYTDADLVEDDDPLALDALDQSILRRALVEEALVSGELPAQRVTAQVQVRRQLPVGSAGAIGYRDAAIAASELASRIENWRRDKTRLAPATFTLDLGDGWILDCTPRQAYREGLLHWSTGTLRGHHWLRPWFEYLALAACAERRHLGFDEASCVQITLDKSGVQETRLHGIDSVAARAQLLALLRGYCEGLCAPLTFFPKSAWTLVATLAGRPGAEASAWQKAHQEYLGDDHRFGESRDAWIALAYRDRDPFEDIELRAAFEHQANRVFATLAGLVHGAPR